MRFTRLLIIPSIFSLLFLTNCEINEKGDLDVEVSKEYFYYVVNEEFDKSIFTIKDKNNNENILDFDVYLNNEIKIDDGYIFKDKTEYDVSIKVNGYNDYRFNQKLYVFNNELHVDTSLMKVEYTIYEPISFEGLVVYDKLNNLVTDYNLDYQEGHIFKNKGNYQVNVTKENYISASFNINILDRLSISLDTTNIKKEYTIGDVFTLDGLVVTSNTGEEITNYESSIKEGTVLESSGEFEVVISYSNYISASFSIKVYQERLMEIVSLPSRTSYVLGETFSSEGLIIKDSSNQEILSDFQFKIDGSVIDEKYVLEHTGTFNVEVIKSNYRSIHFSITISSTGLYIESLPNKTQYIVGEAFSLEGLKVSDYHNLINDYSVSLEEGYVFKHKGTITIKISKDEIGSTSFDIEVLNQKGLQIKNKVRKEYYEVGDSFDSTGLVIVDNNTYQEINDYSLSINDGYIFEEPGTYKVDINKEGYPILSFDIEVIDKIEIGETRSIKIYTINDLHGSFSRDESDNRAGLAYIGDYFIKHNNYNSLTLSMGDMYQGGIESNDTKGQIITDAMNIIGFDAMTLGNHEFDWGEEAIIDNLNIASFPFISSNIFKANTDELVDFVLPSTIIDLAGIQIGIIGSARNNMGSSIIASIANNYEFREPIEYIKKESDKLRNLGCDLVILASHDEGFEGYDGLPLEFEEITEISDVSNQRYVDSMLFAHDHLRKSGTYNDVSFLEAGRNGEYFGVVTINVTKKSPNNYSISASMNSNYSNYYNAVEYCQNENQDIANLVNKYNDLIRDKNEIIYNFKNSYSTSEFGRIVCYAIYWFMMKYNSIFDNRDIYLTTHNTGGIRDSVSSGPFTYSDLITVCPFDNCLALQKCTLSEVNYLKRNSALVYYQNENGKVDSDGYYYCGTISYVAEWTDYSGNSITTDYTLYPEYIIGDVVYEFLINNQGLNL